MNKAKLKKNKYWLALVALLLAVILALGISLGVATKWGKDTDNLSPSKETEQPADDKASGGIVIGEETDDKVQAMSLVSAVIPREQFSLHNISPLADSAYTVTATVNGTNLTEDERKVTWGAPAFKNASSSWATGKNVSTYLTTSVNGNVLTVTCLKAFGEQILIPATSTYNTAVSRTLTADYQEKIEFTGIKLDGKAVTGTITETLDITGDRNATVTGQFTHSEAYTIAAEVVSVKISIKRSTQLTSAVSTFANRFSEYTATVTSSNPTATINDFLDKETHNGIFLNGYPTTFTTANMETVYNALSTMNSSSQAHYSVTAQVAGGTNTSIGNIRLNFAEIQSWYEAFSGITIDFGDYNSGIVF